MVRKDDARESARQRLREIVGEQTMDEESRLALQELREVYGARTKKELLM